MDKVLSILHKKMDKDLNKNREYRKRKQKYQALLREEKFECKNKDAFAYYEQEVIYRGIENKRRIENAYQQGRIKMSEYYEILDFQEKQKLMDYEIRPCLESLSHFVHQGSEIYIPFFNDQLNRIYAYEIILLDLKQYHRLMRDYQDQVEFNRYGNETYKSTFSSLEAVGEYKEWMTCYDTLTDRLFFLNGGQCKDYITLNRCDDELLRTLSLAYFYQDASRLIDLLLASENINQKTADKCRKQL